jgi:FtsP/CotA-like multicopper oxidase with cupredoxin domain
MLTRRDLVKLGFISGGYLVLGPDGTLSQADDDLPASPPTTPFVDELLAPGLALEVAPFLDLPQEYLQNWVDVATTRFFKIVSEQRQVQFHSELPPTTIWGYRDLSPGAQPTRGAGSLQPIPHHSLGPTIVQLFGELGPPRNQGGGTGNGIPVGGGFVVRHINQLPKSHRGFGVPRTTVHLHGGHHLARADGFPENLEHPPSIPDGFPCQIVLEPPGPVSPAHAPACAATYTVSEPTLNPDGSAVAASQVVDYYYPILDPGDVDRRRFPTSAEATDPTERPATQWYHDHLLDFTGPNSYRGLVGFVLCFDEYDSNDEEDPGSRALRLPSGKFDVPLAIQDKRFDRNGNLVFAAFDHDGFLGDKFVVNGRIQPYLEVERRKYRFRVLNGSNARIYQFFLTGDQYQNYGMDMIATEGGLLSQTIRNIPSFMVAMAERVEVVVDFSRFPIGTNLYLENRLAQDEGREPDGLRSRGDRLLQFRVVRDPDPLVGDPSQVPDVLRPFTPIPQSEIDRAVRRSFRFDRSHGAWTINGELAGDLADPVARPKRGQPEIWHLENNSGGWWHPIHIHSEFMRVLRRNGRTPSIPVNGRSWVPGFERDGYVKKDTILLRDNESVDVFLNFRDHLGPFVFHCHNMEHEDMAMMARFDVIP